MKFFSIFYYLSFFTIMSCQVTGGQGAVCSEPNLMYKIIDGEYKSYIPSTTTKTLMSKTELFIPLQKFQDTKTSKDFFLLEFGPIGNIQSILISQADKVNFYKLPQFKLTCDSFVCSSGYTLIPHPEKVAGSTAAVCCVRPE
jgi:hypothetical protein